MKSDLIYPNLSYKIVGVLFEVYNDLGHGYQEKYYQRAIAEAFKDNNINFKQQVYIPVRFKNTGIGSIFLDFLIEGKIILEIKRGNYFSKRNIDQIYAYLRVAKLKLGILANFTSTDIKFKRILNLY
ncbi:MAG TPA: GxxExxY protein [Patescibacteria group bacterium]|nr:GxxExxY protein [Patescibacteria group bacterium]